MNNKKPFTIYEISKKAGVSIATVSRALNTHTKHKVASETLSRIQILVKQYGYTPSLAARHLGRSTFQTIGVMIPHFRGVFFSDYYVKVLAGVADALFESEYTFKLIMLKPVHGAWDHYDFKAGEAVDGLLITHWHEFFSTASIFERVSVPCVVINDPEKDIRAHFVCGDNVMGGKLAARHLYAKGHRKIAVLTGPAWSSDSALRLKGFQAGLKHAGKSVQVTMLRGDFIREKAREAARAFLQQPHSVTAFFCCNDGMALGVLDALRERDLSCPNDISVIGYDDDHKAQASHPSLTTIRVPVYEIAKEAVRRLIQYVQHGQTEDFWHRQTVLPVELVERRSVMVR